MATFNNSGDGPFGPVVNGTQIVFFEYRPSKPAGYAFMSLFATVTLIHLGYMLRYRGWFFIPFILGGCSETFGYYGRALASDRPAEVGPFIMQNILLLAGAPFLAASIYMSFGRTVTALEAQRYSFISVRWMTKLYVLIDLGCIVTQFIGSILPASGDPSAIQEAQKILIAGLVTQLVALSFFILTCGYVHRRIKHDPSGLPRDELAETWQRNFFTIEAVTFLILMRSIVRSVEFLQGNDGIVSSHEAFIYVFDATPMFMVMVMFLVVYPGRLVREARKMSVLAKDIEISDNTRLFAHSVAGHDIEREEV